jgi:diaminopimelate decarboxylase
MPDFGFDSNIPFSLEDIARIEEETGMTTPYHVYHEGRIRQTARELKAAFGWVKEHSGKPYENFFAVKAFPNPHILEILKDEGMGADCSSMPELNLAARVRIPGKNIMFTSNDTPDEEFVRARELGAIINIDDILHITAVERALHDAGMDFPKIMSVRYNPGTAVKGTEILGDPSEAKYGVPLNQLVATYSALREMGVKEFGIHTMMASNERSVENLVMQSGILFEAMREVHEELGIDFESANLGGGIGIRYRPEEEDVNLVDFANGVEQHYRDILLGSGMMPPRIVTESGRAITGQHGWLVSKVRHIKQTHRDFVGLDSCMANLMRPGMYSKDLGPIGECYHHLTVLGKEQSPKDHVYDFTGSLCESNDVFARQRDSPEVQRGDVVVIHSTGAHGHAMGFNYNGKLRSGEVLLREDGTAQCIRRAETEEDYFATLDFPGSDFGDLAREGAMPF